MIRIVFCFITVSIACLVACSSNDISKPSLYFEGSMDSVSVVNNSGELLFDGWYSLKNNPNVYNFDINNIGGIDYAYQEITQAPVHSDRKALHAVVLDDDPNVSATTRAQMTLTLKDGVDLGVYHTSVKMYFPADVAYLKNYPGKISWFVIWEAWNKRVNTWDGNYAGSARWGINIFKDADGTDFYWVAKSETMQPASAEDISIWSEQNRVVPIPIGKWFTMDVYLKRGEGSDGRFIVKITPEGESTKTLFDIKNSTVYPGHSEIQVKTVSAFKIYFSDSYLDWMRTNNKMLSCYYTDFKWLKN